MAPEPLNKHEVSAFPASKLAPFLRALADPEGRGDIPSHEEAVIRRVEENLAERERLNDDN
jgi:hypothetical protein